MELRTASTITLALVVAASIASACELLPSEPLVCAPNPTIQEPDPACMQCIETHCGNVGENCAGECEAYGKCTCACGEDDIACFDGCADDKTEECTSCEDASANAVVECLMDKCQGCIGGGGSASASASAGDDNADGNGDENSGGGSWSDSEGGDSWSDSEGSDSWGDSEGGDSWSDSEGGSEGGGAACDELHSQCCPNLEDVDLEICETAVDELSCEIWLDIFREEGSC